MAVNMNGLGAGAPKPTTTSAPRTDAPAAQDKAAASQSNDEVTLSNQAQGLKAIEARIAATPDVDQAKVDAIRASLTQGKFEINSQEVAQRMLGL